MGKGMNAMCDQPIELTVDFDPDVKIKPKPPTDQADVTINPDGSREIRLWGEAARLYFEGEEPLITLLDDENLSRLYGVPVKRQLRAVITLNASGEME